MSVLHSKIKNSNTKKASGIPLLHVRKNSAAYLDPKKFSVSDIPEFDILDEAIAYFRMNIYVKLFKIECDADNLLVYLTVFIQKILETAYKYKDNEETAKQEILKLKDKCEWKLTDNECFICNLIDNKNDTAQFSKLQEHLKLLREEAIVRMKNILYDNPELKMDKKYWIGLGNRRFLNYEMPCLE